MRTARIVSILAVALLVASPLWAAPKKAAAKKAPPCPADQQICKMTEGLTLTDDQKAQLGELKKEFGPKLMAAMKKVGDVLTADQKKARAAAEKAAKAEGKKGKELHDAVAAAVTLTDEQKAARAEANKAVTALRKELGKAAMGVLTPEQKAELKKAKAAKKAK